MRLDRAERPGSGGISIPAQAMSAMSTLAADGDQLPGADMARTVVALAPDGILVVGPEGIIVFANPAAADMFGYTAAEMVGLHVDDLVPEGLRHSHRSHRSSYADAPNPRSMGTGFDLVGRRADGSPVAVEINLSPVSLDGTAATIAVVRHVADQRAREAERRRQLVLEEEERIASQLHDRTVRRLFLAAMRIQSVIPVVGDPVAERLHESVDDLDTAIREIRHSVFTAAWPDGDGGTPARC